MYVTIWAPRGFGSLPYPISLMALLLRLAAPSAPPRRSSGGRALPRVVLPEAISSECHPSPPPSVSLFSLHGHSLFFFGIWSNTWLPVDVPRLNFSWPPFLSFHAGLSNPLLLWAAVTSSPCALLVSIASELLRTGAARRNARCSPSPLYFGSFCLLYLCVCHWMLLQAAGLVLSAVVVTVRFLWIAVIGALGTLKSCESARRCLMGHCVLVDPFSNGCLEMCLIPGSQLQYIISKSACAGTAQYSLYFLILFGQMTTLGIQILSPITFC